MALINCAECGARNSDKAPACRKCGAPIAPTVAPALPTKVRPGRLRDLFFLLALVVVVAGLGRFCSGSATPPAPIAPRAYTEKEALLLCQQALKLASRDPEKANIPYVQNFGDATEAYFAWGASTKMARMRNGLGLEVAASASCNVNMKDKRITSLTLDGKSIL